MDLLEDISKHVTQVCSNSKKRLKPSQQVNNIHTNKVPKTSLFYLKLSKAQSSKISAPGFATKGSTKIDQKLTRSDKGTRVKSTNIKSLKHNKFKVKDVDAAKTKPTKSFRVGVIKHRNNLNNSKKVLEIKAICLKILNHRTDCCFEETNSTNIKASNVTKHTYSGMGVEAEIIRNCAKVLGYSVK